ncbi:MAG: DUF2065 domain-containing protein [Hyphomicrobiaceae bacterium]
MNDLIVAAGLVLVIEGLIWAISPASALRMLATAAQTPDATLRVGGAIAVALGCMLVWLIRG